MPPEIRYRDEENHIHIQKPSPPKPGTAVQALNRGNARDTAPFSRSSNSKRQTSSDNPIASLEAAMETVESEKQALKPISIYPYGVARNRLEIPSLS